MCGIVAAHGHLNPDVGLRMLRRLAHRGPDGEGHASLPHAWLGHRRLAIVDVEGGQQPLSTPAGSAYLVGNGEIYNHEDLRHREVAGPLRTRSDNEVALHLFDQGGADALGRLQGMYALAGAGRDGRFVAARDPLGIKPLYWAQRDGVTLFASELKAFDAAWRPHARVFPPGHCWTPDRGLRPLTRVPRKPGPRVSRLLEGPPSAEPPPAVLAAVRDRLVEAVERRLMADVPVGVFLSGGLDSSLVTAIAARAAGTGRRVPTFAVGIEGSDDLVAARQVADLLGTDHHERVYTADELVAALPEVVASIESFDPQLVHSAVPNHFLAELAARHVKVVLTGEGADELFAGYAYQRDLDGDALSDELVRGVEGLHNLNLQRCDRVTMAHGLEARVPFLDLDVVELGLALPARWKAGRRGRTEKWLLRRAFHGWLPDTLLMRRKQQFGDGTGASSVLRQVAHDRVDEHEFRALRAATDPPLRTREEACYWKLFADRFDGVDSGDAVGRFAVA